MLKKCAQAERDFLCSTAHELRSPLTAIIGMAEMIKQRVFGDNLDKYVEYAADIKQSGDELLEFVNDLLDLSKVEKGQFMLGTQEWLDIRNVLERAVRLNMGHAHQQRITIQMDIDKNLPQLYADGRRLRQIFINLLNNSIKYSPSGTTVTLTATMKNGRLSLATADQGFGMSKADIETALTKWGTVNNARSGMVDSSGLGLSLTKHLAELHNAEFTVDSTIGKGTVVELLFPADRLAKYPGVVPLGTPVPAFSG